MAIQPDLPPDDSDEETMPIADPGQSTRQGIALSLRCSRLEKIAKVGSIAQSWTSRFKTTRLCKRSDLAPVGTREPWLLASQQWNTRPG